MNPAIVIPSYWARDDRPTDIGELGTYDHVTPVDRPLPELETCLASLDKVRGVLRTIVLLVAPLRYFMVVPELLFWRWFVALVISTQLAPAVPMPVLS